MLETHPFLTFTIAGGLFGFTCGFAREAAIDIYAWWKGRRRTPDDSVYGAIPPAPPDFRPGKIITETR